MSAQLLPSNYQETSQLFTILAIVLGGAWAITTWIHQERLRRKREIPGFESEILFSQAALPGNKISVTVDVVTKNTGDIPIWPVIKNAHISLTRIDIPAAGFIKKDVDSKPQDTFLLAPDLSELCLEPRTRTIFSAFYIADPNQLYSVEFFLPTNYTTKDGQPWHWSQRRPIYVSSHPNQGTSEM